MELRLFKSKLASLAKLFGIRNSQPASAEKQGLQQSVDTNESAESVAAQDLVPIAPHSSDRIIKSELIQNLEEPQDINTPKPAWMPDWNALIEKNQELWARSKQRTKQKILIGEIAGGHPACTVIETTIAASLALRGAEVHVLLCDGILPACLQCTADQFADLAKFVDEGPQFQLCKPCYNDGLAAFEPLGLKLHKLSEFVNEAERHHAMTRVAQLSLDEISLLEEDGINIGEHVIAAALRFFATGDLSLEEHGLAVARRYAAAALISKKAAQQLFEQEGFDCIFMNHGMYVPHGMVRQVAAKAGARTTMWEVAAKGSCLHLSHDDGVFGVLNEPTSVWENMRWSEAAESQLMSYLKSRHHGSLDWLYTGMHAGSLADIKSLAEEFKIDFSKPTIGMLTNVIWDAALFYPANAFPSQIDWMIETIKYFSKRPDLNLVIRVHPAEVRGNMKTRQTAQGEIAKVFSELPKNVYLIPPESKANTYVLMSACDAVIIYGTTTGMELTSMGIPVIAAGQAFIRNKGISLDASSPEEYQVLLNRLPFNKRMDEDKIKRARMYAYNYYFRRSVPLKIAKPIPGWPPIQVTVESLSDLLPGVDLGLDTICDGILYRKEFIYPAEEVCLAEALIEAEKANGAENSFFEQTSMVTMHNSIRDTNTLELTVRSILNNDSCSPMTDELIAHLREKRQDDTYQEIFNCANTYLREQLNSGDHRRKALVLAAQKRLHSHYVESLQAEFAYSPETKPNPSGVYYPNPSFGKSLFEEQPFVSKVSLIQRKTSICFAGDEIASILGEKLKNDGFNCLELKDGTEKIFEFGLLLSSLNVPAIRQLLEYSSGLRDLPQLLISTQAPNDNVYRDPFQPKKCFRSIERYNEVAATRREEVRKLLSQTDVCVLSIRSTQVWRLRSDDSAFPSSPAIKLAALAYYQNLDVAETVHEIQRLLDVWRTINPKVSIILAISPLPLEETHSGNIEHIVCSTAHAKATLRAAVEEIVTRNPGVAYYYPSFDAVMYATSRPFEPGQIRLSSESSNKLFHLFEEMFIETISA